MECLLTPGVTDVRVLGMAGSIRGVPLSLDAQAAVSWVSHYQHKLWPCGGGRFPVEDLKHKVGSNKWQ